MLDLWLAVEGGGSKTRILLADPKGKIYAREVGQSASPLYLRRRQYVQRTRPLLKRVKSAADAVGGAVSVAGMAGPMDTGLLRQLVCETFGEVETIVCGEGDVGLACYGLRAGVCIVAGTGSSCRYHDGTGRVATSGGIGPQFDDAGSGYWIGREGITAAIRAYDGRGPATSLVDGVCAFFQIPRIPLLCGIYEHDGHVAGNRVAAAASVVFAAAAEGDAVARDICRRAGVGLAEMILAAVRKVGVPAEPIPLVPTGGVFRAGELITRPMQAALRREKCRFKMYPPVVEPAEGIFQYIRLMREGSDESVSRSVL